MKRTLGLLAASACIVAGMTACSDSGKNSAAPAGTSTPAAVSSPAAAPVQSTDFCSGLRDLAVSTRKLASQSSISPAEYTKTADQFDNLKSSAPADAIPDIETISSKYRAIGAGTTTITAEGPAVAQATLHLQQIQFATCPPPTTTK
ncbi:hypothetical protein ACIP5Y_10585 [Nocardia sp. NPDC088792]|uniref:hypothetical protein n=1 Tax=Nocardia sp. NPDC088792 TaxID=3364332 RepID=UPI0038252FCF